MQRSCIVARGVLLDVDRFVVHLQALDEEEEDQGATGDDPQAHRDLGPAGEVSRTLRPGEGDDAHIQSIPHHPQNRQGGTHGHPGNRGPHLLEEQQSPRDDGAHRQLEDEEVALPAAVEGSTQDPPNRQISQPNSQIDPQHNGRRQPHTRHQVGLHLVLQEVARQKRFQHHRHEPETHGGHEEEDVDDG